MLEATIKKGFVVYIFLSIFEFALTYSSGSLLKLYGFVLMGGWGILLLRRRMLLKRYLIYLILFFLWMALSLIWSPQGDMDVYYVMAMGNMIALVLISSTLNWSEEDILRLLKAFQLGALFFSVLIIMGSNRYYEGSLRYTIILFGSKMDPNNIAGLLIPGILLSFNYLLNSEKLLISFTTLFAAVFAFVGTGSRGGMIALLLGMMLLLFHKAPLNRTTRTWKSIKGILGIAIFAFLIYSVIQSRIEKPLLERYDATKALSDRGSNRLDLWERGLELFNEKPLAGIGIGGFEALTGKGLHNQFLIVLVEGGIIGFSLFIIALIQIIKMTRINKLVLPLVVLLSTFVVCFFLDAYNKKFFWNGILLAVIMVNATQFSQSSGFKQHPVE